MRIFEYREFLVASISPKIIAGIFDISTQFDLAIVIYRYLFRNNIPITFYFTSLCHEGTKDEGYYRY